jgi:hypothetical protein
MMKKGLILLVFAIVLFSDTTYAQRFNGGLMAGVIGSQVAGDTYSGFNKAGIFAGAFVNLQVSPRSVFQMELEYFQKGSRRNPRPEKGEYDEYLFRANYIELPIFYQFVINDRFQVEAGPSAGFFINYFEERYEIEITKNPPAKISMQINVGLYVAITQRLKVNIRTNNSLFNIRSDNATGDVWRFWGYGQFHDSLVLSLFYQFRNQSED